MRYLGKFAALSVAAAAAFMSTPASAQPDVVGPDVPITIVLPDLAAGNCTFTVTPRSNVTMNLLAGVAVEWGQIRVYNLSNCGTVTLRTTLVDSGPLRPAYPTAAVCTTTTGCTARAAQNIPYALGGAGLVDSHTQVTVRGINLCFDDQWSVVGGVAATYLSGGPAAC